MVFDVAVAKVIVVSCFHLRIPLQSECTPELCDTVGRVSMDVRPQETQHLPTIGLELVGLPGVMNTLAEG
jgi:hypothetical protein